MKKLLAFIFTVQYSLVSMAQEVAEQVEEPVYEGHEAWSSQTKSILLIIFAVFSLYLVGRTFRNKPEA